jgi:hypothetical protein
MRTTTVQGSAAGREHKIAAMQSVLAQMSVGALVNLNRPPRYVHWQFFQMSVPNIIVIILLIAVFVLALVLPFPVRRRPMP